MIVRADARGRVHLGDLGIPDSYYVVTKTPNGTIYLDPAIITTWRDLEARDDGDA